MEMNLTAMLCQTWSPAFFTFYKQNNNKVVKKVGHSVWQSGAIKFILHQTSQLFWFRTQYLIKNQRMALAEVGMSLPWCCHTYTLVLLATGYWRLFLKMEKCLVIYLCSLIHLLGMLSSTCSLETRSVHRKVKRIDKCKEDSKLIKTKWMYYTFMSTVH